MKQLTVYAIFKDPYWQGAEIVDVYLDENEAKRQLRELKDAGRVNDNYYMEPLYVR